ncbi:MAG: beta-galactosidase [Chloroflexi bacterium]|nr:beta-galactosidase [Chloroflexota bacterium]
MAGCRQPPELGGHNVNRSILSLLFWLLRISLLLGLLSLLHPPRSRAVLGPVQQVETEVPILCTHTRFSDEVEEWKIAQSLELVRELGAATIVEFFPWAYIEPHRSNFQWEKVDRVQRQAENQGIQVIARLGLVPRWAQGDRDANEVTLNYLPTTAYEDFARFVGVFAERYAGKIDRLIIWNEPNLVHEWGYEELPPAEVYVKLLAMSHAAAHAANPNVEVLLAPLAPTLEPAGSPYGLDDLIYLERILAAGAGEVFDAVALHTYGGNRPPEEAPAVQRINFRRMELHRSLLKRYGQGEKPVYVTEFGWNDHPRWVHAVSTAQRSEYTLAAYRWAEKRWPWLEELCLWVLRFPVDAGDYRDHFTLLTSEFQVKPLYHSLQAYGRGGEERESLWLPEPE